MKIIKTAAVFATISAILLSSGLAYAEPVSFDSTGEGVITTTIENELNVIDKEAKAAVYALALARCVAYGIRNGENAIYDDGITWSQLALGSGNNSMFDTFTNHEVPVGNWVENAIGGSLNDGDGDIRCLDVDWIQKFLDVIDGAALGVNRNSLLCGINGNGGIVTIYTASGSNPQCGTSAAHYSRNGNPSCHLGSGPEALYNIKPGCAETEWPIDQWATSTPNAGLKWLYAIKDVYDMAADHYGWSTHFFDMISGMSSSGWTLNAKDYIRYYVLREEVHDRCGSWGIQSGLEGIVARADTNTLADISPSPHDNVEGYNTIGAKHKLTFSGATSSIYTFDRRMTNSGAQCQNKIGRSINVLYSSYLDHMKERLNVNCGTAINAFASQYTLGAASQQKVRMANASTSVYSNGYFIEPIDNDENKGWRCLTGIQNDEGEQLDVDPAPIDSGVIDETPSAGSEADCYNSAGSLGWILCPVINNGQGAVEWLYGLIQGFMKVNTNLFKTDNVVKDADGNDIRTNGINGTYSAWSTFRDIANIAFIVVFLVVIFSQLTGVGIDNYGIKKILPKLIITALLINLSYVICQLAVDVANIVGGGIEALFGNLQSNMIGQVGIQMPGDTGNHVLKGFAAGGVVLTIVSGICAAGFLATSGSVLVPVLIALVTVLISIITFLVILAVRQGMAVILVVISPLAFLAYALPNTKPLFKKWYRALGALLLAYPICSALIYGGEMVSTILLISNRNSDGNVSNFAVALSAAAVSIAPIFLIPGILKGSMGKISSSISNLGRTGRGLAGKRVRSSNFASDLNRRAALGKAGLKFDKDGKPIANWRGRMQNALPRTKASQRRLQGLREAAVKENASNIANAGKWNDFDYLGNIASGTMAAAAKQRVSDLEASYRNNKANNIKDLSDGGELEKMLVSAIDEGNEDKIKALTNIAASQGDPGRTVIRNAARKAGADSGEGKQMLASHIMDNYAGVFKENARWTYEWANANQTNGNKVSVDDARSLVKNSGLRGSQINTMDDEDFELIEQRAKDLKTAADAAGGYEKLSTDQQKDFNDVFGALYAARNDQSFTGAKQGRKNSVDELLTNSGYKPKSTEPVTIVSTDQYYEKNSIISSSMRPERTIVKKSDGNYYEILPGGVENKVDIRNFEKK